MRFLISLLLFFSGFGCCLAQDSTVTLSTAMFDNNQVIILSLKDGWLFRQGNDPAWAGTEIDTTKWAKMKPEQVTKKLADKNKKIEGWFRIKIKLDSSFGDMPIYLGEGSWAASDMYVDGSFFHSYGNTGTNGKAYKENHLGSKEFVNPVHLTINTEHTIAIHFVTYVPAFPFHLILRDGELSTYTMLSGPALISNVYDYKRITTIYFMICIAVCGTLSLLFWLLAFQNPREKNLSLIAVCSTCFCLSALLSYIRLGFVNISYSAFLTIVLLWPLFTFTMVLLIPLIVAKVFTNKVPRKLVVFLIALLIFMYYANVFIDNSLLLFISVTAIVVVTLYYVISSWKILKGAQWAIVSGVLFTLFWGLLWVIADINEPPLSIRYSLVIPVSGTYLSFPLSLLVYVSFRFREIIREVQENARRVMQITEEKKQQALNQQKILEEEVKKQTADLRDTLENLRSTQAQLIQSEKMASLGELTAGIAHEIQNPLNFVNNFSEVNKEMIAEMKTELATGNLQQAIEIANDIEDNEEKINHHGKRADAIVKGMLQHSRKNTGQKEPTDINALADEYLRLSYHGMRAKDKNFNADFKTDFDESIGKISIVPQDIGRVLLNLFNNAFYAVSEKQKTADENLPTGQAGYKPLVTVATKSSLSTRGEGRGEVEIRVKDNGNGIPQNIVDKIFQPFFTTKPTGQGTGLGLSLAYDIVKAHGGEIKVETKENEGSEFIITLLS